MFIFDVETLGKESNSVMLSMAAIYFDPETKPSYEDLYNSAFFVKFDVEDQVRRLDRKIGKTTMQWWAKQCDIVKVKSLKPNKALDVKFEDGYEAMRKWAESKKDDQCYVWARGNLDQLVLDSFEEQLEIKPIWPFNRWRDVRTAIDILYNTSNGYCPVNYKGFSAEAKVIKHNPVDDCAYDAMMLMYGADPKDPPF
jgi:hypothetical protein